MNIGFFTSLWDHMLGTFASGPGAPRAARLDVTGRPDSPDRYLAQLREPLVGQATTTAPRTT